MSELEFFEDLSIDIFDEEKDVPTTTLMDPLKMLEDKFKHLLLEHSKMESYPEWIQTIYSHTKIHHGTRICRIRRYILESSEAYLIINDSELFPSTDLANVISNLDVSTHFDDVLSFKEILPSIIRVTSNSQFLISSHLTSRPYEFLIPWDATHTVRVMNTAFISILQDHAPLTVTSGDTPIQQSPSTSPLSMETRQSFERDIFVRLEEQARSLGTAAFQHSYSHLATFDDIKQRIGPLTEVVARQLLTQQYGPSAAESVVVRDLNDLIDVVTKCLKADKETIFFAKRNIMDLILSGFGGWQEKNIEKVPWNDLPLYYRLERWIQQAKVASQSKKSGFSKKLYDLSDIMDDHKKECERSHGNIAASIKSIELDLLTNSSNMAMAAFWFLISPVNAFIPTTELEFPKWNYPHLELEFDHIGRMDEIPMGNMIHYIGAETKGSYTSIPEAVDQLTRRFLLVDGVLHLGFEKDGLYTGKIIVPYLPDTYARKKRPTMQLCRRSKPTITKTPDAAAVCDEVIQHLEGVLKIFERVGTLLSGEVWSLDEVDVEHQVVVGDLVSLDGGSEGYQEDVVTNVSALEELSGEPEEDVVVELSSLEELNGEHTGDLGGLSASEETNRERDEVDSDLGGPDQKDPDGLEEEKAIFNMANSGISELVQMEVEYLLFVEAVNLGV